MLQYEIILTEANNIMEMIAHLLCQPLPRDVLEGTVNFGLAFWSLATDTSVGVRND